MDVKDISAAQVAGANAGNVTVTGIQLGDVLFIVLDLTTGVNLASQFSVTADNTINNANGTSTNGHNLLVQWYKHYKWDRSKFEGTQRPDGRTAW